MRRVTVQTDGAAWAVDEAITRAANADYVGAVRLVAAALGMVGPAPYPALVRDARRFGSDAIGGLEVGDPGRATEFLLLLRHVVEEMGRLDATVPAAV
jgi:hypothetical protein